MPSEASLTARALSEERKDRMPGSHVADQLTHVLILFRKWAKRKIRKRAMIPMPDLFKRARGILERQSSKNASIRRLLYRVCQPDPQIV